MAKLKAQYCIVCEDARTETLGKLTLLGFFGLLPNVLIQVQELNKSIDRLLFLLNLTGDAGKYSFTFEIVNPKGKVIHTINLAEMNIKGGDSKAIVAFVVTGLVFTSKGKYEVRLSNAKNQFYISTFTVAIADPAIFNS
jgi:hypothetical protein